MTTLSSINAINSYLNKDTNSTTASDYSGKTALGRYFNSASGEDLNAKDIFTKLSIDLGGDGKTITKKQLDSYIKNAENKKISVPDEELESLKEIQDNWSTIADGGDSISYSNINYAGYEDALLSMAPDKTTIDLSDEAASFTNDINKYLMDSALGSSTKNSSESGYKSLLKTLLTGTTDENDDANANLIDKLTNLIASLKETSTIDEEA